MGQIIVYGLETGKIVEDLEGKSFLVEVAMEWTDLVRLVTARPEGTVVVPLLGKRASALMKSRLASTGWAGKSISVSETTASQSSFLHTLQK